MLLVVLRDQLDADVTIGRLSVDGLFECYTLEDPVRPDGVKIRGETAIPAGRYSVTLTHSPRFRRILPLLQNVNGFEGIRIHPGNDASDTEGCVLVGVLRFAKSIGRSVDAFNALFSKLSDAQARGEQITMDIR